MKIKITVCILSCVVLVCCASTSGGDLVISRGKPIPEQFITVVSYTATQITLEIRVNFNQESLYHIFADEEDNFLSERWSRTSRDGTGRYKVTMDVKEGFQLERGKRYLLCLGDVHPDQVRQRRNTFPCLYNAWITLQ